ncbi:hypothetical protein SprV_0501848600 [Sparganum proliferum]
MPSSDTSSSSWSDIVTDESKSSTSLEYERSSSLEDPCASTYEEGASTAEVEEKESSARESLRKWALRSKTPHLHLNDLLKALKPWLPDLPADARTLLGATYFSAPITAVVSGEYVYLGLAAQLNVQLRNLALPPSVEEKVTVSLGFVNLTDDDDDDDGGGGGDDDDDVGGGGGDDDDDDVGGGGDDDDDG